MIYGDEAVIGPRTLLFPAIWQWPVIDTADGPLRSSKIKLTKESIILWLKEPPIQDQFYLYLGRHVP